MSMKTFSFCFKMLYLGIFIVLKLSTFGRRYRHMELKNVAGPAIKKITVIVCLSSYQIFFPFWSNHELILYSHLT